MSNCVLQIQCRYGHSICHSRENTAQFSWTRKTGLHALKPSSSSCSRIFACGKYLLPDSPWLVGDAVVNGCHRRVVGSQERGLSQRRSVIPTVRIWQPIHIMGSLLTGGRLADIHGILRIHTGFHPSILAESGLSTAYPSGQAVSDSHWFLADCQRPHPPGTSFQPHPGAPD
jgi:hypothetical protein